MSVSRKYIHVAKNMSPVLTREAAECISNEYAKLRTTDNLGEKFNTLISYYDGSPKVNTQIV